MEKLTVDIIIPVYRPDEKYIRLLQGLKKQIYPIHKIIIMNTERKYYEEDRYPQLFNIEVHHIQKSEFDHGGTRNQAVQYSNSDIIFFLTQDAVPPDRHLVENILKPFEDEWLQLFMEDKFQSQVVTLLNVLVATLIIHKKV